MRAFFATVAVAGSLVVAAVPAVAASDAPLTQRQTAAYTQIRSIFANADEIVQGSYDSQLAAKAAIRKDARILRGADLGAAADRALTVLVAGAPMVSDGSGDGPTAKQVQVALRTLRRAVAPRLD
jgi:hypothetical protein